MSSNFYRRVPLDNEGLIYDFAWSPTSEELDVRCLVSKNEMIIYTHENLCLG